jgi:hypothetical protein
MVSRTDRGQTLVPNHISDRTSHVPSSRGPHGPVPASAATILTRERPSRLRRGYRSNRTLTAMVYLSAGELNPRLRT